jgi:DNA-binding NtrC family response regulator
VIDDDKDFRHYLVALLERAGYEVLSLQDSGRTRAMLALECVDAVVTDLYMPNADGIEIVGLVRETAPMVPVIGVSGSGLGGRDPCIEAMKVLGARTVLTKPLNVIVFLAELRGAIQAARQGTSTSRATASESRRDLQ